MSPSGPAALRLAALRRALAALGIAAAALASTASVACAEEKAAEPPAAGSAREVEFDTADGGRIHALLRGNGDHAVVLAHGAVFDKESWDPFARKLAEQGVQVLAIDFRGYGKSKPGERRRALYEDVLGAVRYLRESGAGRVSLVGASMGGAAVARAASELEQDEIDRVVLLSYLPRVAPERVNGRKLVIVSRREPLARRKGPAFAALREPKRLVELPGSAHAQHIFGTDQGDELTKTMIDFLTASPEAEPEPGDGASTGLEDDSGSEPEGGSQADSD